MASSGHNEVTIYITRGETFVDWGDGNTSEISAPTAEKYASHTYENYGTYTITLSGDKTYRLYTFDDNIRKALFSNMDIGTQYESIQLHQLKDDFLTSLSVPKDVDVYCESNVLASVTYEDGRESLGTFTPYVYEYPTAYGEWIGEGFIYAENLASVSMPDSVKTISPITFSDCPFCASAWSNNCYTIGKVAVSIYGVGSSQRPDTNAAVIIPNTVLYINPQFVFRSSSSDNYDDIASLTIGSSVKVIGWGAFYSQGNNNFTSLTIPDSVETIDGWAFGNCVPLTTLTLGSGLKTIGAYAFRGTRLSALTIPASVTSIGVSAFETYGDTLTEVHFTGSTPPAITGAIFLGAPYIYVPVGAVPAYEAAGFTNVHEEGWQPPHDISLTWETGAINPTTGANSTDSNAERSSSTSNLSEVLAVKWLGSSGAVTSYKLMVCCYNKSDGTYAGTYNGTSVVQGESWLHANDYSSKAWNDDLSGLTAYDFRFVIKGKWGSAAGQGQYVVVYGIE